MPLAVEIPRTGEYEQSFRGLEDRRKTTEAFFFADNIRHWGTRSTDGNTMAIAVGVAKLAFRPVGRRAIWNAHARTTWGSKSQFTSGVYGPVLPLNAGFPPTRAFT